MNLYDINKSFIDNWRTGPQSGSPLPVRQIPPKSTWHEWLGFNIMSRIGIPACPIMTGKGIALMSQLGFDVLTYKTIRQAEQPSHPWPNIKYVDINRPLTKTDLNQIIYCTDQQIKSEQITIANSFGNSCLSPQIVAEDIDYAKRAMQKGQVLIVSIYGEDNEQHNQINDYVSAACLAKDAGADIIEANISCPNLHAEKLQSQKNIFSEINYFYQLIHSIVLAVQPAPLLIKLGYIADDHLLRQILMTAAYAGVAGITGINTFPMQVKNKLNEPVFGKHRQFSGVSGFPIKQLGLDFIKRINQIKVQEKLDISILGCGGITEAQHFTEYHEVGADIAMSATGVMWNSNLGMTYHKLISSEA